MPRSHFALTLIETLVSLVIVMILTATATVCYTGALDHADLRFALPELARRIGSYQDLANEKKVVVTVECPEGQTSLIVTMKGLYGARKSREDLQVSVLKRRLVFKDYKWPDGTKSPRTFTFVPGGRPLGGTVRFGSSFADGKVLLQGDRMDYEL